MIFTLSRHLAEADGDLLHLGILGVCFSLTYAVNCTLFGHLSDRLGHRRLIGAGAVVFATAYGLALHSISVPHIFAVAVLGGMSTALVFPAIIALLSLSDGPGRRSGRHQTRTLILFCLSWNAGVISGNAAAGWLFPLGTRVSLSLGLALSVLHLAINAASAAWAGWQARRPASGIPAATPGPGVTSPAPSTTHPSPAPPASGATGLSTTSPASDSAGPSATLPASGPDCPPSMPAPAALTADLPLEDPLHPLAGDHPADEIHPTPALQRFFAVAGWMANFSGCVAMSLITFLLPRLMTELGVSAPVHGTLVTISRVAILGMYFLLHFTGFWRFRLAPGLIAQAVSMAGLLVLSRAHTVPMLATGVVLVGVMMGYNYFSSIFYSTTGFSEKRRGLASGLHEGTLAAGHTAGSLGGGYLGATLGIRAPFRVGIGILAFSALVQLLAYLYFRRRQASTSRSST